ncbi:MAG: hypothetical protein H6850_01535 [Alphaproteobacteria bacterium]|nr:MAG: hypothetical protein H6850_01535 [Alphaproteobacteria bacterium]
METKLLWVMGLIVSGLMAVLFLVTKYFGISEIFEYFGASMGEDEGKRVSAEEGF